MLKAIPFVFYTATYTDEKDEELALKLGADRFIVKPVEPDAFIKIIQGVIRDADGGRLKARAVKEEGKDVFKLYSERLVKKLEKKMLDLEREIAERKQAEDKIRRLNEELEECVASAPTRWPIGTRKSGLWHDCTRFPSSLPRISTLVPL